MVDKIFSLIDQEAKRQKETLMMIPSENYTYPEVRSAVGSILMHKYAEGDPGRRYYQGNEFVDQVEATAEGRVLECFNLNPEDWHVNVQPHSGCEANLAVYNAILDPGDKIMSMFLPDGGHLSHGWHMGDNKITLVSKIFNVSFYNVDPEKEIFDFAKIALLATQIKPKLIISGGTAYPRDIDYKRMAKIAHRVGAYYMADVAHEAGLIIAGANNSPFPHADFVTFTTHKTLRGPRGAVIVARKEYGEKIDRSIIPGLQGGPHLHSIAGIAVALEKAKTPKFKRYGAQTVENAKYLAQLLKSKGLHIVSGGTDKHLVLIDLREQKTNGWFAAWALEYAGIIANRNTVPSDTGSPFYPSGLRLGTPAITVRGMKEREMKKIADWIHEVIEIVAGQTIPADKEERNQFLKAFRVGIAKNERILKINKEVKMLCKEFPIDFE
ncbi:serine hydroxymethyltransferase [Candidatus Woesebacteria bacterium]|nr:MAG: serine hydroxymethyltransferase [Candidatus Woesebacteria bacterium]